MDIIKKKKTGNGNKEIQMSETEKLVTAEAEEESRPAETGEPAGEPAMEQAEEQETEQAEESSEPSVTLPEHPLFEVDVHMNTGVLYDYMLRHTYTSPLGLVATLLGVMSLLFFMRGAGVWYLLIGIVMLAFLPWNLFLTARRQAITNEAFKKPLHYTFAEEGVYVSQGDIVQMQSWDAMYKAIATSVSIVLYTSRVNASVFPRKDLGDDAATVVEIISTHMPPRKVRIRR